MNKFLAILVAVLVAQGNVFGAWVMFNDGIDTYIYNNLNGDIFVRHRGGGENYEDKFIKMPAGVIPQNMQNGANQTRRNPASPAIPRSNTNQSAIPQSTQNPAIPSTQSTQGATNPQNTQNQVIQKEQVDALERRFQELESNLLNKALE